MTEQQRDDERDLIEAKQARAEAELGAIRTAVTVGAAARASDGISTIVDKNGYVERFRQLIRGT